MPVTTGIPDVLLALVKPSSLDEPLRQLEQQRDALRATIREALEKALIKRYPDKDPKAVVRKHKRALALAEERLFERHSSALDYQISLLRDFRPRSAA